jgi:4-amino-4-deoxy-L-arabinose transferase-like glycosyltransferase
MKCQLQRASAALIGIVLVCGAFLAIVDGEHIRMHQLPTGWDETLYINDVCAERFILAKDGVIRLAKSFISLSRYIPPGYRMAAIPTFLVADPTPPVLKALAFASLTLTAIVLFLAGRQIASAAAGMLWAGAFSFSVGPYMADTYFGTEITLYPAVAGCLYAVTRWFRKGDPDRLALVVLALSTATGALSKASFFAILVPLIGAAILIAPSKDKFRFRLDVVLAVGFGLLAATPWWLFNWAAALQYARYSSTYYRHDAPWASQAATSLFGVPFTISLLVVEPVEGALDET